MPHTERNILFRFEKNMIASRNQLFFFFYSKFELIPAFPHHIPLLDSAEDGTRHYLPTVVWSRRPKSSTRCFFPVGDGERPKTALVLLPEQFSQVPSSPPPCSPPSNSSTTRLTKSPGSPLSNQKLHENSPCSHARASPIQSPT